MSQKKLNESSSKTIEENFLKNDRTDNSVNIIGEVTGTPELQRVIFCNNKHPGCCLEFIYNSGRLRNQSHILFDGQEVVLDDEVIKHLEGLSEPIYNHSREPENGRDLQNANRIQGKRYLYQFRTVR
ncbi:MAG: hypothetical protein RR353_05060 [Victivallaceae bacterium]